MPDRIVQMRIATALGAMYLKWERLVCGAIEFNSMPSRFVLQFISDCETAKAMPNTYRNPLGNVSRASSGAFTDCRTGYILPVVRMGDYFSQTLLTCGLVINCITRSPASQWSPHPMYSFFDVFVVVIPISGKSCTVRVDLA